MIDNENDYKNFKDFIVFLDDKDIKRSLWVKILKIDSLVTFKLTSGRVLSIPPNRILKIRQDSDEVNKQ